ncbi:MAG: hypothetical protein AAF624_04280, partial [Bacteroidota bacterium]
MNPRLFCLPVVAILATLALTPMASAQEDPYADPYPIDCSWNDAETTYSLYYEYYRQEDYASAKPYLRCMLSEFPLAPNNDGRNFDRAIRMHSRIAAEVEDATLASAYRDSVLLYMDARTVALEAGGIEYNAYEALIDKANYLYNVVYDATGGTTGSGDPDEVFGLYEEADTAYPDSVPDFAINFLGQQYLERGMRDRLIEWGPDALERIDTPEGQEYFEANILDKMFEDNAARFTFFYERVQAGERDPEVVGEVFDLAFRLGRDDAIAELKPIVLDMEPSPR